MQQPNSDYKKHWDEKFRTRRWGRYPPEDLVRFFGRSFGSINDRNVIKVLEAGCGPGANLWFLHREGYDVSGIDGSPAAIEIAQERLACENAGLNTISPDLRAGDFRELPWNDDWFDCVIDIFAIYANTLPVIRQSVSEIYRVLKPGGLFYTKLWGRECTGFGAGQELEPGTYDDIPSGPCADMGVSHFFDRNEIEDIFSMFETKAIDVIARTDVLRNYTAEEYHCQFTKAG